MSDITRVRWSLLAEWWCAPLSATEDEVADAILEEFEAPGVGRDLVKDRCYGGFNCQDPLNRHIAFNTGAYTYTGQFNSPLTAGDRAKTWSDLLAQDPDRDGDGDNGFIGDGPFTKDAPKLEEAKP